VNPIISSYIANLTAALPTGAQPTGTAPTALPSSYSNGTDVPTPGWQGGMTLKQILDWIAYLLSEAFQDVSGNNSKAKRWHARDLGGKM